MVTMLTACPRFPDAGAYRCDPAHPSGPECDGGTTLARCDADASVCTVLTAPSDVELRGVFAWEGAIYVVGTKGFLAELHDGGWQVGPIDAAQGATLVGIGRQGDSLIAVPQNGGVYLVRRPGGNWTRAGLANQLPVLKVFSRGGNTWIDFGSGNGPTALWADGGFHQQDYGLGGAWVDTGAPTDEARLAETLPVHMYSSGRLSAAVHDEGGSLGNGEWPADAGFAIYSMSNPNTVASALVAGAGGVVLRVTDAVERVTSTTDADLFDIFGATADEAWLVGDRGTLLRYDAASRTISPQQLEGVSVRLIAGVQPAQEELWLLSAGALFRVHPQR